MAPRTDTTRKAGRKRKLEDNETSPATRSKRARAAKDGPPQIENPVSTVSETTPRLETPPAESNGAPRPKKKRVRKRRSEGKSVNEEDSTTPSKSATSATVDKKLSKKERRRKRRAKKRDRLRKDARKAGGQSAIQAPKGSQSHNTNQWTISSPTAGRFLQHDPIFVQGENGAGFLITANKYEVQLLSIETSLPLRTHAAPGRAVVCFTNDAIDDTLVYIAYNDGLISTWNWDTDTESKESIQVDGDVLAIASAPNPNDAKSSVFHVGKLTENYAVSCGKTVLHSTKERLDSIQALGNGEYLVASGPSVLVIGLRHIDTPTDFKWVEIPFTSSAVCMDVRLSLAPNAQQKSRKGWSSLSLAVGLANGQILLYPDVSSLFASREGQGTLPTPRTLHWHRIGISSVKFSQDGNYLISGGKETVLVIWQLETGKRQYLPHLTSEIEKIVVSPDGTRYALQMGDNSIMVLSTSELKPVAQFAGLQTPSKSLTSGQSADGQRMAATLHPHNPHTILLAVPSTQPKASEDITTRPFLQTYDLRSSRHISRQALTRNNTTDFNLGPDRTPIVPPDVTHLAISPDGEWLATVDEWIPPLSDIEHLAEDGARMQEEQQRRREIYLKIWRWDDEERLWTLSTRMDAPHRRAGGKGTEAGRILDLTSAPKTPGFATVGEDGSVKIWSPKRSKRSSSQPAGLVDWYCRSSLQLPRATFSDDAEPTPSLTARLAYSTDGSLLAVATSNRTSAMDKPPMTHFLDAATGDIATSRSGLAHTEIQAIGFLGRYLIALSKPAVYVWDLVDDVLMYKTNLSSSFRGGSLERDMQLAINQDDGIFAIVLDNRVVEIYSVQGNKALHRHESETSIEGILFGKGAKGFTVIFSDATIRILSNGRSERPRRPEFEEVPLGLEVSQAIEGTEGDEAPAVDLATPMTAPGPRISLREDIEEDDRPVVRPEQLAEIFESGQGFAMPPVRDMFRAVVGLFARKPLESRTSAMVG